MKRALVDVSFLNENLGLYNVYIFTPDKYKSDSSYSIYDICRFCDDGQDKVNEVTVWSSHSGFTKPMKFERSFRGNYYGSHLRIGSFWWEG